MGPYPSWLNHPAVPMLKPVRIVNCYNKLLHTWHFIDLILEYLSTSIAEPDLIKTRTIDSVDALNKKMRFVHLCFHLDLKP